MDTNEQTSEIINSHVSQSRVGLPTETYQKHRGKWIALSADGERVIAASPELDALESQLVALGEDPQKVLFDHVEESDVWLGGAELL